MSVGVLGVWGSCGRRRLLTLADLALLLDVPGVERPPLLVLHGRALVEVLGQVGLVQPGGLHHLPLGQVVLLHVTFHHLSNMPGVLPARGQHTSVHLRGSATRGRFIKAFKEESDPRRKKMYEFS